MSERTKFTIYRDSWLRGEKGKGMLHRAIDHKMCCIGQMGCQAGLSMDRMGTAGSLSDITYNDNLGLPPASLRPLISLYEDDEFNSLECVSEYRGDDTAAADAAMGFNDDDEMDDFARESKIINIMKEVGIEVTFVDGLAPWFTEAPAT
jgi:hypothetical protein